MATTAGERRSWLLLGGLFALASGQGLVGCDVQQSNDPADPQSLQDLLAAVYPEVIGPALDDYQDAASTLAESTAVLAETEPSSEAFTSALTESQQAWLETMDAWQVLEPMQVGPAASSLSSAAGEDLRDEIYSWPSVNPCRVDQETVAGDFASADFFDTHLVNVGGLDALETLLFAENTDNGCPSQVDINSDGSWEALGSDGVWTQRAAYAAAAAAELVADGDALQSAWRPDGGDHSGLLASGAAPYDSRQDALNAVYDAMFYLETGIKERKLGPPLGLGDCTEDSCIDDLESPLAGTSHLWVVANLDGVEQLFTGGSGAGFDDLLVDLGHDDLDTAIRQAITDARVAADALTVPLEEAPTAAPDDLQALYDAVDALSDLVRDDLSTVLTLQVPAEAAGDND